MKPNRQSRKCFAFTLLELMVVISIIAFMTALLLPALGKSRAVAKLAMCQSNLKSMGMFINQYITDCHEYVPAPTQHVMNFNPLVSYKTPSNALIAINSGLGANLGGPTGNCSANSQPDAMTVNTNTLWPVGLGWSIWQGYADPFGAVGKPWTNVANSKLTGNYRNIARIFECPDSPIPAVTGGGNSGTMTDADYNELNYGNFSRCSQIIARGSNDASATNLLGTGATINPYGANWDCLSVVSSGYGYRGWNLNFSSSPVSKLTPKANNWKPGSAMTADYKTSNRNEHDFLMNVGFIDGHVKTINGDINDMHAYEYFSSITGGGASSNTGNSVSSYTALGSVKMWNYYETGQ